jgi:NAD(P)H dehydrogenase (quinone)
VTRIAVVFHSATGNVHALAHALAAGAEEEGAEVRVRRAPETAPPEAIAANERWQRYVDEVAPSVPEVRLDDLEWADGLAFGSPTRFGGPTAQLKSVLDQTGGLWFRGALVDKVATGFTSASTGHGGLESTILALNNVFYHWGAIVLPVGYSAPIFHEHGNPYGASWVSRKSAPPDDTALEAARQQGRRLAQVTGAFVRGRATQAHEASST